MALSETLLRWRRRGAFARVRDLDVFHVAEGRGPTLLVLHGFPTSAYDFSAALPGLAARHRVVLFDMPGFGLSSKPAVYSYSLVEQADIVQGLCAELGIKHVWMHRGPGGGSVSQAATAYGRERGITVIDGGCPCMFGTTADPGHKAMRFLFAMTGNVPRQV